MGDDIMTRFLQQDDDDDEEGENEEESAEEEGEEEGEEEEKALKEIAEPQKPLPPGERKEMLVALGKEVVTIINDMYGAKTGMTDALGVIAHQKAKEQMAKKAPAVKA